MSGIDALIAIRKEFPEARIIMLTTFDSESERQRAREAGACAFLLKSAHPKELTEIISCVHIAGEATPTA